MICPRRHTTFSPTFGKIVLGLGVKSIAGKVGSKSLDALVEIASNVITELIKAQFGL